MGHFGSKLDLPVKHKSEIAHILAASDKFDVLLPYDQIILAINNKEVCAAYYHRRNINNA